MSRRPARRYYGTPRNAPTRPVIERSPGAGLVRRVLFALAGLVALAWAADRAWLFLTSSPTFRVRSVELRGVVNADPAALRAAAALEGRNVFTLDLPAARERLLSEPWACDARLRRRLPDAVLVEIDEKSPEALERRGEALALLDEQGSTLEENVAPGRFELPRLEGAASPGARARAARVLAEVRDRAPEFWREVDSIDASREDRLVLHAAGHPPIWVAGPESVDELLRWTRGAQRLEQRFGRPAHVDARWRGRLYLGRS